MNLYKDHLSGGGEVNHLQHVTTKEEEGGQLGRATFTKSDKCVGGYRVNGLLDYFEI